MAEVKYNLGTLSVVPSGAVVPFAGSRAPVGYLLCDGSEVSRTDYPYLFDTIGTLYGEGDGLTTFNLPNLQDKFIQGSSGTNTVGTEKEAGLPNIEAKWDSDYAYSPYFEGTFEGAFYRGTESGQKTYNPNSLGTGIREFLFDASRSNAIYGNSDTVQPPAVVMNYIIKY